MRESLRRRSWTASPRSARIDDRIRALAAARAKLASVVAAAEHPERPCEFTSGAAADGVRRS